MIEEQAPAVRAARKVVRRRNLGGRCRCSCRDCGRDAKCECECEPRTVGSSESRRGQDAQETQGRTIEDGNCTGAYSSKRELGTEPFLNHFCGPTRASDIEITPRSHCKLGELQIEGVKEQLKTEQWAQPTEAGWRWLW